MSKYNTGSYHVVTFDKYGSKIETIIGATSYLEAVDLGNNAMTLDPNAGVASFIVYRVLFNSLDKEDT